MQIDVNGIFSMILGSGGIAFAYALVKAHASIRAGAAAKDRDTVGGLRDQRDEAEHRAAQALRGRDYYHDICGRLVFQLREAGLPPDLPPGGLAPPALMEAPLSPARPGRRRRGRAPTHTSRETLP